jgi:sugar phosphate isomerase/epimerase
MKNRNQHSPQTITRRSFCLSAATATAALGISPAADQATRRTAFFKNLATGHIGVRANQQQALDYAVKYGFDSITPGAREFEKKSDAEIRRWLQVMKAKGVRYGTGGLPVNFRGDDNAFKKDLARLPEQAALLQKLGVDRVATWILPGNNNLTYLQNFKRHKERLGAAAKVLRDYDIRLGLEFIGPHTLRNRFRFPFACTQIGMMELVEAIGTGNVGLLLDSWHWYTSHGTVNELLQLTAKDVVHVHVNDAPAGIDVDQQQDNRRQLPVTSGVIDMKGFINALVRIGYDGPIECEPFDQELRQMDDPTAVEKTAAALERVWALVDK